jgi:hypothetical protein
MIEWKRFIRPGIVISVVVHVGAFALGLISFAGSAPQTTVPPDAMEVELVTPTEAPRLQGTPSELRSSGSEAPFKANRGSDNAQPQPPKPPTPSPQQTQQPSNPQLDASREKAQPKTPQPKQAQPKAAQPEMLRSEKGQPETAPTETSEQPPAPPEPHPEETPDQPTAAEMLAELALAGGRLGGGFDAPPVDTPKASRDFTTAFRERVSSCSALPPGIAPGDKVSIVMRVLLNRDGTLASTPQLLEPLATEKQLALMQSSIMALQKCQPYTMLPPEKYNQWKKLDLTFYPFR